MNKSGISKKIDDLNYRMAIAKIAVKRAGYNLKFSSALGLSDKEIRNQYNTIEKFSTQYAKDKCTADVLEEYQKTAGTTDSRTLFKCTFPAEEGYINDTYQTSIVCKEDVARLFANGVNYDDVVGLMDSDDILNVETTFDTINSKNAKTGNVDVELAQDSDFMNGFEMPVTCGNKIIAAGKVQYCVPTDECQVFDLFGNEYKVSAPSFDDISFLKGMANQKFADLENKVELAQVVKYKMDTAIERMNSVLDDVEKYNER
jgi:hypothetical protein